MPSNRLSLLMQMNPHFANALSRREKWAVQRAEAVQALDGFPTSRRFPERDLEPQGPKNWCGSCPFAEGCMVCDLPYDPGMNKLVAKIAPYDVSCPSCKFRWVVSEATSEEDAMFNTLAIYRHGRHS